MFELFRIIDNVYDLKKEVIDGIFTVYRNPIIVKVINHYVLPKNSTRTYSC